MKCSVILSILLLVGLLFIPMDAFADIDWVNEEGSCLSVLDARQRRVIEYERALELREITQAENMEGVSQEEGGPSNGTGESEVFGDDEGIIGDNASQVFVDDGIADTHGVDFGEEGVSIISEDLVAGTADRSLVGGGNDFDIGDEVIGIEVNTSERYNLDIRDAIKERVTVTPVVAEETTTTSDSSSDTSGSSDSSDSSDSGDSGGGGSKKFRILGL